MKLAIHQPEFMPWPGFFNKMALADQFVILDHVQYKKRYFENRNRIVSPAGEVGFIGVPVYTKGKYTQPINQVEIDNSARWAEKVCARIYHCYGKAPYFENYFNSLKTMLTERHDTLLVLNLGLIEFFRNALGISTPLSYSSQTDTDGRHGSELILHLCCQNKAKTYLCGSSGRDYLDISCFDSCNIGIEWLDYRCPQYQQLSKEFYPNLSTLDLLFNHGPASLGILQHQSVTTRRSP